MMNDQGCRYLAEMGTGYKSNDMLQNCKPFSTPSKVIIVLAKAEARTCQEHNKLMHIGFNIKKYQISQNITSFQTLLSTFQALIPSRIY